MQTAALDQEMGALRTSIPLSKANPPLHVSDLLATLQINFAGPQMVHNPEDDLTEWKTQGSSRDLLRI